MKNRLASTLVALWLSLAPALATEQASVQTFTSGPHSATDFTTNSLNPALRALFMCNWGPSAPANGPGGVPGLFECWANTTTNPVVFSYFDGASWVQFGHLNTAAHIWMSVFQGTETGTASIATTGTSGHTLGFLDGLNIYSVTQTLTINQNGSTVWQVSNNSVGVNAFDGYQAANSLGAGIFGVGGTGYTGIAPLQNRTFLYSQSALSGIAIWTDGANPINFYNNGVLSGGFSGAGIFSLATPMAVPSGGSGAGTFTAHGILLGEGTAAHGVTAAMTDGQLPVGQTGADPLPKTISGDWTLSAAGAATISNNAVTFAKFQQIAALSMFGNCTNSTANGAAVTGTANQVLRVNGAGTSCAFGAIDLSQAAAATGVIQTASVPAFAGGDVTSAGGSLVLTIGTARVTYAMLANRGPLSVAGRSANTSGVPADISCTAASDAVLRESGSVLGCGTIATGGIAANAVTNAKLATMAANTVKGNATGGSAAPTDVAPASARSSSLLNVDSFTGQGNANYTILSTDRTVGTNAAFTASRTWTLPAANAVNPGQEIIVADFQGTVTGTNTLVISRAGSDTVNGGTSATISAANGAYLLKSDGTSKWTAQALGAAAAGGVSSVTCGTGLDGGTITTSGTCSLSAARRTAQTISKCLSTGTACSNGGFGGSGTYTTPANVTSIDIIMVGGGGGGEGSGVSHGGGAAGSASCWNTSGAACTSPVYQAGNGGAGSGTTGGVSGTVGGSGTCDMAIPGGNGSASNGSATVSAGSSGAGSALGGQGGGGAPAVAGQPGQANTGGGGGGASINGGTGPGAGGGAGAYCAVHISAPAATYTYVVGAGGSGGTAGTSGLTGGVGGSGGIWVKENYNIN